MGAFIVKSFSIYEYIEIYSCQEGTFLPKLQFVLLRILDSGLLTADPGYWFLDIASIYLATSI
jgi:hypothetical protein